MDPAKPSLELLRALTDEHVLRALMRERRLTRAELAAATGISKPTAGESVRRLVAAGLVADTGQGVPELASLKVSALHLPGSDPHVDLGDDAIPLSDATVQILSRWLSARAEIIAELQGSDPGHLWVPTKPGRPRGGQPPVKPGLNQAAVRTLHAAHRSLVSQLLGAPLRPGALRDYGADPVAKPAAGERSAGEEAVPEDQTASS